MINVLLKADQALWNLIPTNNIMGKIVEVALLKVILFIFFLHRNYVSHCLRICLFNKYDNIFLSYSLRLTYLPVFLSPRCMIFLHCCHTSLCFSPTETLRNSNWFPRATVVPTRLSLQIHLFCTFPSSTALLSVCAPVEVDLSNFLADRLSCGTNSTGSTSWYLNKSLVFLLHYFMLTISCSPL